MTTGDGKDAAVPARPVPVVRPASVGAPAGSLPAASSPAGSLPPGSAPAVGPPPQRRRRDAPRPVDPEPTPPAEGEVREIVRATKPPRRQPLLLQGAYPAALALGLALAASFGTWPFVAAVLLVQVFLVLGVLALVDAPASGGAFLVGLGATVAADAVVVVDEGQVRGLAGVVALSLVAALLHQLTRTARSRVTESLADTLVVVVLSAAAASLLALRALEDGEQLVQIALVAAGAGLLAGRVGDRIAARPMLAVGSTRGWPGLVLGLGAGVAGAVAVAGNAGAVVGTQAALFGLVCAATVAAADLAVDLGASELRAGWRDARRVAALKPSGLLLPFALLGPISLVAGQLVLG